MGNKSKPTDKISKRTVKFLKENDYVVSYNNAGKSKDFKYSKAKHLAIFKGYDLLENMIVVRQYVQKRYDIDLGLLEILLYLVPKQYFTQLDYREMPKQFRYCLLKNLIETGYVSILQEGRNASYHLYKINRKGHEIVTCFYETLSGERTISENRYDLNPLLKKKETSAFDKKRMDLISKINQLPAPEAKKGFYQ